MDEMRELKLRLAAEFSERDEPIIWPKPKLRITFDRMGTHASVFRKTFDVFKANWDSEEKCWVPNKNSADFVWVIKCPITNEITPLYVISDVLGSVVSL